MEVRFVPLDLSRMDVLRFEAIALAHFDDERPLRGAAGLCDWRMCGAISRWIARGCIKGQRGELVLLPARSRLPFDKILLVGLGARDQFGEQVFTEALGRVITAMQDLRLRSFVLSLPGRGTGTVTPADAIRWFLASVERADLDEVVLLEDPEAQRQMAPFVEAERRRVRAARQIASD